MKPYIIPAVILLFVACEQPAGDEQSFELVNTRNVEAATASIDSLASNITSWDDHKFDEAEEALRELRQAVDDHEEGSQAYDDANATYMASLKQYEEARIEFLHARKEELKAIYGQTSGAIAALDESLAELERTRKDPYVTSYAVTSARFKDYFNVQGNLEAKNNAQVFAELSGNVTKLHVEKGARVSKNQLMVSLDTEIINKQIDEVKTSLALAEDLYERQQRLWDQEIGSELQYLEAKNRKESLEGTLATLNEQLSMGQVRAPFAGVVDELNVKVGEMASPMMPVARIVNRDELYIEADVSERHFGTIGEGNEVLVSVQGMDDAQEIPAHVSRVGSYIKADNRTFQIRVDFDSTRSDLIPNLVADLKINEWDSKEPMPVLPNSMIQEDALEQHYIWKLMPSEKEERMKVQKVIIETGRTYKGQTCVLSGLAEGDVIIDKGARKVKDGIDVRVESPSEEQVAVK